MCKREPRASREDVNEQLVNCRLWSVTMLAGILNRQTQWDMKALVTVEASMEESGMASNHLEWRSQQVIRFSFPGSQGEVQ